MVSPLGFAKRECLIPAWLVLRVPALAGYRTPSLVLIILAGFLLILSPFLNFVK